MTLDPTTVRRLAFVRYLHGLGVEQSRLPEPLCSTAVLMIHDAVETFLLVSAEHLQAPPVGEFEKYWGVLNNHLPPGSRLGVKQGMTRLNKVRVNLKHHGAHPDTSTIQQIVTDTATFMTTSCLTVFGVDYETLSMAAVIPQSGVRTLVIEAENKSSQGDFVGAMVALTDAYTQLFGFSPTRSSAREGIPFEFGDKIRFPLSSSDIERVLYPPRGQYPTNLGRLASQINSVTQAVMHMRAAIRITSLGLDLPAHRRFCELTPSLDSFMDGHVEYWAPDSYAPSGADVAFCCQFLVTAALRLAAAESHLETPAWFKDRNPMLIKWNKVFERVAE